MSVDKYPSIFSRKMEAIVYLLYGKVNPSALIGSLLVRISPYGPFPWKRSSAVYLFCFQKPANSKRAWPSAI